MRIHLLCHSLLSDWNHGNAHFLRGVAFELRLRGHDVVVHEPRSGWSRENLLRDHGAAAIEEFLATYPGLTIRLYDLATLDLDEALDHADLVIVHEWSDPELVRRVGEHRRTHADHLLFFHDTHHRLVTAPDEMLRYDLRHFDAVLAFGEVLRSLYIARGLAREVFTWHEAADVRVFRPLLRARSAELVWIGNWGDDERTSELREFLIEPVRDLGIRARIHGVRYPEAALEELRRAGIVYEGFLPNVRAPAVYARHAFTVHVPRRPYVEALVGVPTIRVFEALACGIPLVSAPWTDSEGLFSPGADFLVARDGAEMTRTLRTLAHEPALRASLARSGREAVMARHTCSHRVDELLSISARLGLGRARLTEGNAHAS